MITISSMNKVNVFLLGTYSVLLLIGVDNQALPNGDVNVRQQPMGHRYINIKIMAS
jgi:hypothetical protein